MSNKTIAKFLGFVILTALSLLGKGCTKANSGLSAGPQEARNGIPQIVGRIKSADIIESSGIAASRCQTDVFWTHNDSGGGAFVYAINRSGDNLGKWLITNVESRDWEDIATGKDNSGKCFIYIGDIGDNKLLWPEHSILRVAEPVINGGDPKSSKTDTTGTLEAQAIRFIYPDINHDAEALMVHPRSAEIFLMTKNESRPTAVYRISGNFDAAERQTAVKIAEVSLPSVPNGLVTGADISPDGRSVIVCDYKQAYEFVLPDLSTDFAEVWKQKPDIIDVGRRKTGEAICYSIDGIEIFATSEGRNPPIISVRRSK